MTDENEYFLNLKDRIREEKKFHRQGWERMKKYYEIEDEKKRYEETGLKNPPHEHIKDTAKSFIRLALSSSQNLEKMTETSDVLLGVGVELLLKSIILKNHPQKVIGKLNDSKMNFYTPSFRNCTQAVKKMMKDELTLNQLERMEDVLTLMNNRRNELAHLHFHHSDHVAIPYQILIVIEFLFTSQFSEEKEFIAFLLEMKEKNKLPDGQMNFSDITFPYS